MSKIIITGGAGFIGSALVWGLNSRGQEDILVVDSLDHREKEHNLAPLAYDQLISGEEFRSALASDQVSASDVEAVLHLGAISSTVEDSWERLRDINVNFTQEVIRWCADKKVRCVYASSGAVYGDGSRGYSDEHNMFERYTPLNLYGRSKLEADIWARDGGYLKEAVGLRYFNVFGPNEYHKGYMRSVIAKKWTAARDKGIICLFKSNHYDFEDGGQLRDFLYVKDAVRVTLFFLDNRQATGMFNVGTGMPRTWNDLASAMFKALGVKGEISYVDLPPELAGRYQNYTRADTAKLRAVGYKGKMTGLEQAVEDYLKNYLLKHLHLGEASDNL